jgi:hypothetical protein
LGINDGDGCVGCLGRRNNAREEKGVNENHSDKFDRGFHVEVTVEK